MKVECEGYWSTEAQKIQPRITFWALVESGGEGIDSGLRDSFGRVAGVKESNKQENSECQ